MGQVKVGDRINAFGVELEGGWSVNPTRWRTHADGSLAQLSSPYQGEISSPVIPAINQVFFNEFMGISYPSEVNGSCGYHIHVSLIDPADYHALMDKKFYNHFLRFWKKWGETTPMPENEKEIFVKRLAGTYKFSTNGRSYCERKWKAQKQVNAHDRNMDRYCHLNFCYNIHGTIENRLLPMFSSKTLAIKATLDYLLMIEQWLADVKRKSIVKIIYVSELENECTEISIDAYVPEVLCV